MDHRCDTNMYVRICAFESACVSVFVCECKCVYVCVYPGVRCISWSLCTLKMSTQVFRYTIRYP